MYTARTSSLIDRPTLTAWTTDAVDARDRDDHPLLAPWLPADEVRPNGELSAATRRTGWRMNSIIADEQRHEDHDQVRAVDELHRHDDDEHDRGQRGAERVHGRAPVPAGAVDPDPVPDHPDLREGEADEHADRVQRDQGVRVAAERREQAEGDRREDDDAPRVGQPVAAERELAGHEPVLGEDRREAGERVEARVCGQEQDERCRRREGRHEPRCWRRTRPGRPGPRRTARPARSAGRCRPATRP